MFSIRKNYYKQLERELDLKLLVYVTSDRPGMETQIAPDVIDSFINQLDRIGSVKRIGLYLYTCGGDTSAAWNIINLIKMYCDELIVIIPYKALSAGTLISLGANKLIMTKQAVLGSIDPSLNTPLNPKINNETNYPVSVEAVKEYFGIAKDVLKIEDNNALANILIKLSEDVHPLVLGQVFRTRSQIKMLAKRLLSSQIESSSDKDEVINFLCSDSGSHDYTINRREAKNNLKLNVVKPNDIQYKIIKNIYDNIIEELEMRNAFSGFTSEDFEIKRGIVESMLESDMFITKGKITSQISSKGSVINAPEIIFEGWRKMDE